MSKKPLDIGAEPSWPTMTKTRWSDGRVLSIQGEMWLYRAVPLGPADDARSPELSGLVAEPLLAAYEELANLAGEIKLTRRATAKSSYRDMHVLLTNLPQPFEPARGDLSAFQRQSHPDRVIDSRSLLLGVRLVPRLNSDGIVATINAVAETLAAGAAPLEDFERDRRDVDAAMARCGLLVPTERQMRLATNWWNQGNQPDIPYMVHSDHLHMFTSVSAAQSAARIADTPCEQWPETPDTFALSFATVTGFTLPYVGGYLPEARWASRLVQQGAVAISIRGKVEPALVTRAELRRMKKNYISDITERYNSGKMQLAEQEELLAMLSDVEAYYARGGSPTIIECSTVVAFSGRDDRVGYDPTDAGRKAGVELYSMADVQERALAETMVASAVRANPHVSDLPSLAIGYSGLPSLSVVGDRSGALVGFTERDRQPAYMEAMAATDADTLPICLAVGQTGSGKSVLMSNMADQFARERNSRGERRPMLIFDPKALALDTVIPTPDGWSTVKELQVGDRVFGGDGRPCTVRTKSQVFSADVTTMFDVAIEGGQVIRADADHLWLTLTSEQRARDARTSQADKDQLLAARRDEHAKLTVMANLAEPGTRIKAGGLLGMLRAAGIRHWKVPADIGRTLRAADVDLSPVRGGVDFDMTQALAALAKNSARRVDHPFGESVTTAEMLTRGLKTCRNGLVSQFAVVMNGALDLPEADLPVHPYLLGAWLGDGTSTSGDLCAGVDDAPSMVESLREFWPAAKVRDGAREDIATISLPRDRSRCLYGHSDYETLMVGTKSPKSVTRCATCHKMYPENMDLPIVNDTFGRMLGRAGLIGNKHIPAAYLRASREQRMLLLQGLMDTDGTVTGRGDLRIVMTREHLTKQILELVRSLGFKATLWEGPARLVEDDPDRPGRKRTREVGRLWQVVFRTSEPVFRLPRKAATQVARSADKVRSRYAYVKDITPALPEPAQCISVDSPDRTFLVGEGLVRTHNSSSDFSRVVQRTGGQVFSLDRLATADGIFDPIRTGSSDAIQAASTMLAQVNPWGTATARAQWETPMLHALTHGVSKGATCILQALEIAESDGEAPPEMVEPVRSLSAALPMFRSMCGQDPHGESLSVAEGITYIKVGKANLDLPEPGTPTSELSISQRVTLSLVRSIVYSGMAALTDREGVVMLDEAWVFTQAGKSEMVRMGRLARSQRVLPVLFTQKVTDAIEAGLEGFISRGIILPITDKSEAVAACRLFGLDPTAERIERITAKATMGDSGQDASAPNWHSMRALIDPITRQVLRGTIGIYADVNGRAVPVEITIPPDVIAAASTNRLDMAARDRAELALETGPELVPAGVQDGPVDPFADGW